MPSAVVFVLMLMLATRTLAAPQPLVRTDDEVTTLATTTGDSSPAPTSLLTTDGSSSAGNATNYPTTETSTVVDHRTEPSDTDDSKDEVPQISRYVPPLDPMKHMLMMAEAKKVLVSSTESNVEETTTERQTTTTGNVTETTESSQATEITSAIQTTTDSITTTSVAHTDAVLYVDPEKFEKTTGDSETTPESATVTSEVPSTVLDSETSEVPTTVLDSETSEVPATVMESETSEVPTTVLDSETSEVPTTVLDSETTTISTSDSSEILHESSVIIKSSELFSGKEDSVVAEGETDNLTTPSSHEETESVFTFASTSTSIPTETSEASISSTTSEKVEISESEDPALERNEEDPVIVEDKEPDVLTTLSNVETTVKVETTTPKLTFASTEITSPTTLISTTVEDISVEEGEALEKLSSSQSESVKNISVEDSLAFRDPGLAMNFSEVVYDNGTALSSNESLVLSGSLDAESVTVTEEPKDIEVAEDTTTTFGIFTTIKELFFSTTTEKPLLKSGDGESEIETILKEDDEKTTDSPTTEILLNETESVTTTSTTTIEPVKVELLNSDIQTTSYNPTVTSTVEPEAKISTTTDTKVDTVETFTEAVSDDLKINKESLELSDDHPRTTDLSDPSSTTESKSTDAETVTASTHIKDVTESVLIEKFLVPQDRYVSGDNTDTVAAVQFLHYHDKASSEQCFKLVNAHWNYATNLTDENKKRQLEQTLEYALFHKEAWRNATSFAWKSFNDTLLRRWFRSLSVLGTAALPEDRLNEFNRLKADMKNVYSTAKICPYIADKKEKALQKKKDCNLTLEPDLARILTKSRDYDELTYVWKSWRDAAGKPIREKYLRFINLSNEAARLNGFADNGDMWRESYESDSFEADLEDLWEQLRPLYENLHAYVRRKLIQQYGGDKIKEDGPIPAHLLGNMWAQSWVSLMDIAQPFPGKPSVDVTPIMEAKNLSALEMFKISEEFFTSLGLKEMPEEFWKHSLIEKPKDREIICHASAWDFCNGKDYRIKQCTDITMEDLITVHHEMGHIQYFLQYARQPNVFREGANPGFHEAIGDVLALSVSTPKHLKSIGLLEEVSDDPEGDLNFLLFTALDKVSFLPSGYLIDLWRWGLFNGEIKPEEMNTKWWDLRLKYQGICPPVKRTDTDFDPGAKFHVSGNVPYIRYFVSFVIQFQFHKVLCEAAGHTGPLYKCDIYRSKEAGQILSQVMELGSSEHWSEAMKIMTGGVTNRMDAGPILEYFQPLLDFLVEQNRNETLGWKSDDSTICP